MDPPEETAGQPGGDRYADGMVGLFALPPGALLAEFRAHDGAVLALAEVTTGLGGTTLSPLAPRRTFLVSAGADTAVKAWDTAAVLSPPETEGAEPRPV